MTLKSTVSRIFGPRATRIIRRAIGREHFDEVNLVNSIYRKMRHGAGFMIDVGAHHGHALAPFVEDGWSVLAFEPDAANRMRLESAYGDRISIVCDAVGDKEVENRAFFSSGVSSGISSLSAFHESHEQSQTVSVTTLAKQVALRRIDRIDFLKVDTEGHDLFVLRGHDWSVLPHVIVCEFEDRKTEPLGYKVADIFKFLSDRGYVVRISEWKPIVEYGQKHTWRRFISDPAQVAPFGWGNLIAAQPGGFAEELLRRTS